MNRHIYFRNVDVHKISFFSNERVSGVNSKEYESDKMFFGMNLHVGFYAENFFW
jgi:hypothetical protein